MRWIGDRWPVCLRTFEREQDSVAAASKAVQLRRELYDGCQHSSNRHAADLASYLDAYSIALRKLRLDDQAKEARKECVAIRRRMFTGNIGSSGAELGVYLRNYGEFLVDAGHC